MANSATNRNYHHGDLKAALVAAAQALIREEGIEGFSLRKATARAGVSPGAYAHHFHSAKGLLTEVAIQAFKVLGAALAAVPKTNNPAVDLRMQAKSYVTYAAANPGMFRLLCRIDLVDSHDPRLAEASFAALFSYGQAAATYFGAEPLDPMRRILRSDVIGAMATAHGLAHMLLEGRASLAFNAPDPDLTFVEEFLPTVLSRVWP